MSYSRRVSTWLIYLCARALQGCCNKVEMISVWLLFLKLLRATAGVGRPNGSEINDARKDSLNQQQKEQETHSNAVAMETGHISETADLKDYKMDQGDTEEEKCQRSEEDERDDFHAFFSESLDTEKSNSPTATEHQSNEVAHDGATSEESFKSTTFPLDDILATEKETHLTESTSSPEPDTEPQVQVQPVVKEEDNKSPPVLGSSGTEHQEPWGSQKLEQEESKPSTFETSVEEQQRQEERPKIEQEVSNPSPLGTNVEGLQEDQNGPTIEQDHDYPSTFEISETEHQGQESPKLEQEDNSTALDANGQEHHQEPWESPKLEQEDNNSSALDANGQEHQGHQDGPTTGQDDLQEPLESPKLEKIDSNSFALDASGEECQGQEESPKFEQEHDCQAEQESILEQQIKELAISDASTESFHDNDGDDLSDCLQVEMAIVSSDSDTEEQWKSMFSPVVDTEEAGEIAGLDGVGVSEEPHKQEDEVEDDVSKDERNSVLENNVELEDEALGETTDCTDVLEQPECPTECDLEDLSYDGSIHYRSLTKIPEDEEDLNRNAKHNLQRLSASTSELDKKLPKDYCVVEETKSENVSTEHVDFRMARQQWQKMEQNKGQLHQSFVKTAKTCQGGQSYMYTPVRTPEHPRRDQEPDSLSLGDFQYTQFSPCSEDSGLDDTSYRSPYDEPETPVEKEIRESMEREESFRRERALSRPSSGEPTQSKPRPSTLLTGRDLEERRRSYNTPEDRCRSQRSPSSRTPTFSITASPSSKPTYHEMVANNVIILEPDSYPASPRHRGKGLLSPGTNRSHEWPSDMTNVIILETSNLIIRSASEFSLNTACQETQESTFHNNPFFKLRSHSTQSLVDQEIKVVRQRDEEFRRQRAQLYAREKYDTVLVSPGLLESFTCDRPGEIPARCKSSPSSPSKIRRMDRSVLSCDQKFYR